MTKKRRASTPKAVALAYNPDGDASPRVTAKGTGLLAQKIMDIARDRDIPIRQDPNLIELLASVEVMDEIPPALYTAVAETLAFIYSMNELKLEQLRLGEQGQRDAERDLYGSAGNDAPTDQAGGDGE